MRKLGYFSTLLCAATLLATQPARAEDLKGFWSRDIVIDYNAPARENSSESIQFANHPAFAERMKRLQADLAKAEAAKAAAQPAPARQPESDPHQFKQPAPLPVSQPEQPQTQDPAAADGPPTAEQIVAKYGPPDKPRYIKAGKEAPPEMQALIDSLHSGNKELAWQYAVAMAKRTSQLQDVVGKATELQLLAMEAIGMAPETAIDEENPMSAERAEYAALMEKTKRERLQRKVGAGIAQTGASLDQPTDSWAAAQGAQPEPPSIPVDQAGKVKLLIFFDEKDAETPAIAETLKALKNKVPSDANFSVFGLTRRTYANLALKKIGANTGFPYPLLNGEALTQDLQILTYPTYVFVALTSKQTYRLEGKRTADEVEKVVRLMKGGQ